MKITLQSSRQSEITTGTPRRNARRGLVFLKRLTISISAFCFLLSALYIFRVPILQGAASVWIVNEPLQKADAIVVLGGGLDTRPFAAAKLYKQGYAPRVLVARPKSRASDDLGLTTRDIDVARQVLIKEGVPESAIVELDADVQSTHDESLAVRAWLNQNREKGESREQKESADPRPPTSDSAPRSPLQAAPRPPASDLNAVPGSPLAPLSAPGGEGQGEVAPNSSLPASGSPLPAPSSPLQAPRCRLPAP